MVKLTIVFEDKDNGEVDVSFLSTRELPPAEINYTPAEKMYVKTINYMDSVFTTEIAQEA